MTLTHLPMRCAQTSIGATLILLRRFMFCSRCMTTVPSNTKSMPRVNREKYQYSSSSQRALQKIWKTKKGATKCSLYTSKNLGIGMSNLFCPQTSRAFLSSWSFARPSELR